MHGGFDCDIARNMDEYAIAHECRVEGGEGQICGLCEFAQVRFDEWLVVNIGEVGDGYAFWYAISVFWRVMPIDEYEADALQVGIDEGHQFCICKGGRGSRLKIGSDERRRIHAFPGFICGGGISQAVKVGNCALAQCAQWLTVEAGFKFLNPGCVIRRHVSRVLL